MSFLFAASPQSQSAIDLLNTSNQWAQAVSNSLNGTWDAVISPTSPLWQAISSIGLGILALVFMVLSVRYFVDVTKEADFQVLLRKIAIPTIMSLLLLNNGAAMATGIKMFRQVSLGMIDTATKINIAGINAQQAMTQLGYNSAGTAAIQAIIATCNGKTGADYADCLTSIQPQINQVVADFEAKAGMQLPSLQQMANNVQNSITSALGWLDMARMASDAAVNFLKFLLLVVQSCVLICLELALLCVALSAPVFYALAFIPGQFSFALGWLKKYLELFGFKFGYFVVIGLGAIVIVNGGVFSGPIDIIFLAIIAIFGPVVAKIISKADGEGAFGALSGVAGKAAGGAAQLGAAAVTGGASKIAQMAAKQGAKQLANK
ncbi:hypothetical protein [Merismopedia glauca]|uniref:Uncharacterized protein n=1 Tax=Merismopedia glauca CCAP 1448/3 TaxID=1296344 RepID=A0A2T1C3B7_9CYAN|nr:hypothetical protein [Merismopedia glauca]PSB02766.1 hypothetical protein C7B64_11480 [Merismopedia glauca CCAP 1448/3]